MTHQLLTGSRALVTGGARGIGAVIAARLTSVGAEIGLIDIDPDQLSASADDLESSTGTRPVTAVADVADADEIPRAIEHIGARLGGIDILVNNAGAWTYGPFLDSQAIQWSRDIDINLFGMLNVTHAVLPSMIEAEGGRVISIVSDSARVGEVNVVAYSAAKAGAIGATRSLAKEVGRYGVTVNAISLSTTLTDSAHETFTEEQLEKMTRRYPMGRLGSPEDVAGAVAYLAGPDAAWVTGQVLSVNGGYAML